MELRGHVLWWSERDENGIIIDIHGNEYYFDRSVLNIKKNQKIKRKLAVSFQYNKSIKDCLCACKVSILTAFQKHEIENKLDITINL